MSTFSYTDTFKPKSKGKKFVFCPYFLSLLLGENFYDNKGIEGYRKDMIQMITNTTENEITYNFLAYLMDCFKIQEKKKLKDCASPNRLARLIILSGDKYHSKFREIETFTAISPLDNPDIYKDEIMSREESLKKSIYRLSSIKRKSYTLKDFEKISEWIDLLTFYKEDSELKSRYHRYFGLSFHLDIEKFNILSNLLKKEINEDRQEEIEMIKVTKETEVSVFSVDELLDEILDETPENMKTDVDVQALYSHFDEMMLIKGNPVVIPFSYTQGEYEVDMLFIVIKQPTNTGFDECTVGLVDWVEDDYSTVFESVPVEGFPKYIQDLINSKGITYIDPRAAVKLHKLLNNH